MGPEDKEGSKTPFGETLDDAASRLDEVQEEVERFRERVWSSRDLANETDAFLEALNGRLQKLGELLESVQEDELEEQVQLRIQEARADALRLVGRRLYIILQAPDAELRNRFAEIAGVLERVLSTDSVDEYWLLRSTTQGKAASSGQAPDPAGQSGPISE